MCRRALAYVSETNEKTVGWVRVSDAERDRIKVSLEGVVGRVLQGLRPLY